MNDSAMSRHLRIRISIFNLQYYNQACELHLGVICRTKIFEFVLDLELMLIEFYPKLDKNYLNSAYTV